MQLKAAGQGWREFDRPAGRDFGDASASEPVFHRFAVDAEGSGRFDDEATERGGAREDDLAGLGALLCDDDGHGRLDDAGLFRGDFLERMAEEIFVVEVDAGDYGDHGSQNVRGVQATAETHLENTKFDAGLREVFEGHRGDALEVRRVRAELSGGEELLGERLDAL